MKLGFIGFGKMGQAIAKGLNQECFFTDPHVLECPPFHPVSLENLVTIVDCLIICVKPQSVHDLLETLPPYGDQLSCVISIVAGTPRSVFEAAFPNIPVIRCMPNTPATLGEGMTALSPSPITPPEIYQEAEALFRCIGKVIRVNESELNAVTGISGSGPAFFYRLAMAATQVGVQNGLTESNALTLISQTLVGAGKMLMESGKNPEVLIKEVSSPGGTTQAGLATMDANCFEADFQKIIASAINRSIELSKGV